MHAQSPLTGHGCGRAGARGGHREPREQREPARAPGSHRQRRRPQQEHRGRIPPRLEAQGRRPPSAGLASLLCFQDT
eukprot:3625499-Rhodomonas_salina.2